MAKKRLTAKKAIQALKKAKGFLTPTAKELGVSLSTVNRCIAEHETVRDALDLIRESRLDFTESVLLSLVQERHPQSVFFFLRTQGKNRGYSEHQKVELTGKDDQPITVKVLRGVSVDDL